MNNIVIGRVSEVVDKERFVIKATAEGISEDIIAHPIENTDQPEVNDEVLLLQLEDIFGFSFLYIKMRIFNRTRFHFGNSEITLSSNGISISTKSGDQINISSEDNITLKSKNRISIEAQGELDLKSKSKINLDAPIISLPRGQVTPSQQGGAFNSIPICPYTGMPHGGNTLVK